MMDPISVTGLAFGLGSLAFDVFDHSIKLFKFFSSMVDMPKDCERCRLQLMIEYNRLLAWGDAVGLVDVPQGSHLASNLGTSAIELCSIIARIGTLLGEFKDLNDRWKEERQPCQAMTEKDAEKVDFGARVSSLALEYEKKREIYKQSRGFDRIVSRALKGAGIAKEVISHPSRARWVMVDKSAFEVLLKDLHSLIERIHELMSDYRGKQIHETTAKTYCEMVIVRNDLGELKDMLHAVTSMMVNSTSTYTNNANDQERNDETLRDLLLLKKIKFNSEANLVRIKKDSELNLNEYLQDMINVKQYDGPLFDSCFTPNKIDSVIATSDQDRPRGVFTDEGKDCEVWIEWRTASNVDCGSLEDKESLLRTATLAQMLSMKKPHRFLSPTCIGYVDDRKRRNQLGWIFKMPQGSHKGTMLKTVHGMLGHTSQKPTLAGRVSLAWKLASSLLYLHAADWHHKGIHSGNVIFLSEEETFDFEKPILSGFEYSRPQNNRTTSRSLDPRWDIYRWPSIQNDAPRNENFRKTYDIYSLGLLLLEIAHWQPLHKLVSLKRWPSTSPQNYRIRGWLLDEEALPPFKDGNPLLELRNIAGDKYWEATRRCLIAHGEEGLHIQEQSDQSQPEVGLQLQTAFTELVVEKLKTVSV